MTIQSFKDLTVWQKSSHLVELIYKITSQLPKTETLALVSQMNRSAISIPSNIAEGKQRSTRKDFVQFLRIASGSAAELETQLIITSNIFPKIDIKEPLSLINEIQKMLTVMIRKLSQPKS
jgi:four helix bundle protein